MVDLTSGPTVEPEALPGRPYPRLPDDANPQAYGSGLARGVDQAADVLQNVHDKVQAQARETQSKMFNTAVQGITNDLTTNPQNGAFAKRGINAFGLDQQYLPQFDQRVQPLIDAIPDPQVKAWATNTAAVHRQQFQDQIDTHELTQHQDASLQASQASIEMAAQTAANNHNHPEIVDQNKDTVRFNIDSIANQQGWTDDQKAFHLNKALTEFHSTVIDSMIGQGQLSQARTYLYQQTAAGEIDPKAGDGLQRMMLAKEEHDLMMNDKIQRDSSNAVLKNGILMQQNGTLTSKYIEKFHNTLEPQAYEYMYKLLAGKEATTDPHTYAPLLQDAMSGKDVSNEAQQALYTGRLSLPDFKSIIEKTDQPRKGYVARGSEFINNALKPNPMVPDPAGAARSYANALDDWRQWTEDHPEATENEARTTYQTIANHYQVVSADKVTLFNAVPLHLVGSRTAPDLAATWQATKAAHDAGNLSDAEFSRQATLILQWQQSTKDTTQSAQKRAKPNDANSLSSADKYAGKGIFGGH